MDWQTRPSENRGPCGEKRSEKRRGGGRGEERRGEGEERRGEERRGGRRGEERERRGEERRGEERRGRGEEFECVNSRMRDGAGRHDEGISLQVPRPRHQLHCNLLLLSPLLLSSSPPLLLSLLLPHASPGLQCGPLSTGQKRQGNCCSCFTPDAPGQYWGVSSNRGKVRRREQQSSGEGSEKDARDDMRAGSVFDGNVK
eukprot:645370-Hanusia_phi.AAC.1